MNKLTIAAIPLFLVAFASTAFAGPRAPDLEVNLSAPSGKYVYETGTYEVTVSNNGNRTADGVVLAIMLPETANSPGTHVMGALSSYSGSCSQQDAVLVCSLGRLRKGKSTSVSFDIALPLSSMPIVFGFDASSNRADGNPADNTLSYTATPLTYDTTVTGPVAMTQRHCSGSAELSSFYECELSPSSIGMFQSILENGGAITITAPALPPGYTGQWSQTGSDSINVRYFYNGEQTGNLDAYGVGGGCFEGVMHFQNSSYVAVYEICP